MKRYLTAEDVRYGIANTPQITFEVTDLCNLKCKYCGYGEFYDNYDQRNEVLLDPERARRLIDYVSRMWDSSLNVSHQKNLYISFYGGEPLLNMDFIKEIVSYMKGMKCASRTFTFSLTTNAILLHQYIDFFREHDFKLLISLDGNRENSAYRVDKNGKPSFDRVIENIDLVREKYPEYFKRSVNFNAVLHNRNSVESIHDFFKKRYEKMPRIGELSDSGIRTDKKEDFEKAYRNAEESLHQSEHYDGIMKDMRLQLGSYQTVMTYVLRYNDFVYKDYNELLFGKRENAVVVPTGTCMPFSKKIYMTVNGKLLPCERVGHKYALGKVTDRGVELDFRDIAERYNSYYAKIEKQCETCYRKKSCIQCVFQLPDPGKQSVCQGHLNAVQFENYKNAQIKFLADNPGEYYRIMEDIVVV